MTQWPRWRRDAPASLVQYVQYGVVNRLISGVPGASARPPLAQLRGVFDALAAAAVGYGDESTRSTAGRQDIRPPDQVLVTPRVGTCLDVVVTAAGACLDAGLHPWVVVLDPVGQQAPGHAVLLVWLDGGWAGEPDPDYPLSGAVAHDEPPVRMVRDLRAAENMGGAWAAVDIAVVARHDPAELVSFDAALAAGAALLTGDSWAWSVGVDIGVGFHQQDCLPMHPGADHPPLVAGYRPVTGDSGPLDAVRASSGQGRFQDRDELVVLHEWCVAPEASGSEPGSRVAIVYGVGGAGKTHLAAELCARLAEKQWYAGFLPSRGVGSTALAWLATVVSPLLVVVDYADAARTNDVVDLLKALRGRHSPTRVLLTARSAGSHLAGESGSSWWDDICDSDELTGADHRLFPPMRLAPRHQSEPGVLRKALTAFGGNPGHAEAILDRPHADRWTTLDLVMLAWLDAHDDNEHPTQRPSLYRRILRHEFRYWQRIFRSRGWAEPPEAMLRKAGAVITLLAPTTERLSTTLAAIPALATPTDPPTPTTEAEQYAQVLTAVLPADPAHDESIAIRPDPIGDYLTIQVFGPDHSLLSRCLTVAATAPPEQLSPEQLYTVEERHALLALSRAHQDTPTTATALAATTITAAPRLWRLALAIAGAQGDPFLATLTELAAQQPSPLPLSELADTIPSGHSTLRTLALIATQRTVVLNSPDPTSLPELAMSLNNLANHQAEVGDRQSALDTITEAVTHYRQLATTNPAAFLPNLAMSLNNLANHQAEAGDRQSALDTMKEVASYLAPGPAAEIMLGRARWRLSGETAEAVVPDVREAAALADGEPDPVWSGRARRAVREAVTSWPNQNDLAAADLPAWATEPLPDEFVEILNEWLRSQAWPQQEQILRDHHGELAARAGQAALRVALALYPTMTSLR